MNAGALSNGFEDYNYDFNFKPDVGFSGSYVAPVNGRWTANLSTLGDSLVGWQVSSSQSLVLAYNSVSSNILETGDMRAQNLAVVSSTNIAGNNYAQAFSGADRGLGNFESTGSYLGGSGGSLAGAIDFQTDADGFTQNYSATGFYSVDPTTGRSTTAGSISGVDVVFYSVDADTIYMISANPTSLYQGVLTLQSLAP